MGIDASAPRRARHLCIPVPRWYALSAMKIRRVVIENFKRFGPPSGGLELKIENSALGELADRFLLLGDNGSGKTTVLQAIALTLSLAARRTRDVAEFRWAGWLPERYMQHGPPVVELDVTFEDSEIVATQEAARLWYEHFQPPQHFVEPGSDHDVKLRLVGTHVDAPTKALYQFGGRGYAAQIASHDGRARALFARLPGVFWFDQFRNVTVVRDAHADQADKAFDYTGILQIRERLKTWSSKRQKLGPHPEQDFLGELEHLYREVFPGRSFAGLEDVYGDGPTPIDERFVLTDGHRTYALEEMSAGEQSVFPILFEFVRQQIHHSVVLIDEIDLNHHAPLAQRVCGLLPRLGRDNQFIFTSHNQAVVDVVSPHTVYRLPGEVLCL
jgi:hypothetical protein